MSQNPALRVVGTGAAHPDVPKGFWHPSGFQEWMQKQTGQYWAIRDPKTIEKARELGAEHLAMEAIAQLDATDDVVNASVARAAATSKPTTGADEWPDPDPIGSQDEPRPYPLDAWNGIAANAIREALHVFKCPPALAAHSALCAMSAVCMGLADVRRDSALVGPIGIYALAVLESGERKSTVDKYFQHGVENWRAENAAHDLQAYTRYRTACEILATKRSAILDSIRAEKKKPSDGDGAGLRTLESELAQLDESQPQPDLSRLYLMQEPTIEAFMDRLGDRSRCVAIQTAEAGQFFGGHAMKAESRAKTFAVYNAAWDGGRTTAERKSGDSIVDGPRVTLGLAVQPATLRDASENTRNLDRGTGFLARFLFSAPESTQGTREYQEPPTHLPARNAFASRIKDLLDIPLTYADGQIIKPVELTFTPEAKAIWIAFHNATERDLRPGGELADAKDIASKAADNVARVAALFHVFDNGPAGNISAAHVAAAVEIIGWHLFEAKRFLCDIAPASEVVNARKLEDWLRMREGEANIRTVMREGPNPVRHRPALDKAIAVLVQAHRARRREEGRSLYVQLNPALMGGQ